MHTAASSAPRDQPQRRATQHPASRAARPLLVGTVAFVIVLSRSWVVLPNLTRALDARAAAIEGGIMKAEKAQAEAESTKVNSTEALKEARAEAAKIREQARSTAPAFWRAEGASIRLRPRASSRQPPRHRGGAPERTGVAARPRSAHSRSTSHPASSARASQTTRSLRRSSTASSRTSRRRGRRRKAGK